MYSRFLFRAYQNSTPSLILNRFLCLTQVQFSAATKLKEKPTTDKAAASAEKSEAKTPSEDKKPIPPPTSGLNDPNKTYSEKIHRLVDEISKLSLVDVMDLNELLKKTLKIQDVPIMAAGASGGTAAAAAPSASKKDDDDDDAARPAAQAAFKVRLIKIDETKKVPVIKQVKDVVENINLVQAKKLVESIPQVLRDNLSKADAEAMKAKIEAVGGVCVVE